VKIWRRQSEWDYSWIARLESPAEVILCSIYEYSRYALLSLPERISFDRNVVIAAVSHLLAVRHPDIGILKPILFLILHCPVRGNFPLDPYRVARRHARFDPETFLRRLDDFVNPPRLQRIRIPLDATKAKALHILAQRRKRSGFLSGPKRGAGARIRRAKTALKYLGALKLLQLMSAPEAIQFTEGILGRPLFPDESQWSRARRGAVQVLLPYHAEAALLVEALKNILAKST
jgi:hypothetical protein